jgi:hypothetical protein
MHDNELNKVMIDRTHRLYYDSDMELATILDERTGRSINLSETAVLKVLEYMLNHGLKSNINIGTVRDEIAYREKQQEKKDRLEEYIQERIKKEYYEDIPNRQYIHIVTKERVNPQEIREKILKEIEYVSKLM